MTEVTKVLFKWVTFGSTILGRCEDSECWRPKEGLQWQFLLYASEEAGRGLTSCQCLQGDRPSATPSPVPRNCSEPMKTFTALVLSQTGLSPKSELSLLSKKSLDPTLWTTMSQEYTERVQLISVARMASVANTFPWVFASCRKDRREKWGHPQV